MKNKIFFGFFTLVLVASVALAHLDFGISNSNKSVDVSSDLGVDGGAFTMEAWVKINTLPSTDSAYAILFHGGATAMVDEVIEYRDESGSKRLRFIRSRVNVVDNNANDVVTLSTSTWYHLAITYDGSNVRGYRDCEFTAGPTASTGNGTGGTSDTFNMAVFNRISKGSFGPVVLDEVRFWNRALSQDEICAYKDRRVAGNENGLVGYWRLDEGEGTSAVDFTQTGYTGTIVNAPDRVDGAPINYGE